MAGGKQVRFWQGPWGAAPLRVWAGARAGRPREGEGGKCSPYLVVGVRDAQEPVEALTGRQEGPLRPHPKVPLAGHPREVASGSEDLSQGHLLQGQAPLGSRLQNSRVQARPDWESAGQEGSPAEPDREDRSLRGTQETGEG